MDSSAKNNLILYRFEQADDSIKEAALLLENNMLRASTNRIYYGMFYAITALALKNEFETSKHLQLIGWFNQNFIKTQIVEKIFGAYLKEAYEFRQQGDYATFSSFSREEVEEKILHMKEFITQI